MRIFSERSPLPTWERRVSEISCRLALLLLVVQARAQDGHRPHAVLQLGALVLADHHHAGGHVGQAHRGGVLLHVLAAVAAMW